MVAGLQKPIFKTRTSSTCRATTSATLSKTSRSSGFSTTKTASATSFGIRAQRTALGTGLIFNPGKYNSDYISQQRHALNDNRVLVNNFAYHPHTCGNNSGNSTNKFAEAMTALNMFQQMGLQTTAAIKAAKSGKRLENSTLGKDLNTKSTQPKTLSEFNKLVTEANNKVQSFSDEYSNTKGLSDAQTNINDINNLLKQAGVNDININELKLSELALTDNSSLADIDKAIDQIQNTDIASIETLSGSLGLAISSIDSQLNELANDTQSKSQNANKIANLQRAKAKLETLRDTQLPKLKTNLTAQKEKLSAIRKEKADAMDKVYAQAQADDTKIGENNTEMTKLKSEIEKETDDKKKKKLIDKYNGLADENKILKDGLSKLSSNICNSKGELLSLNYINKAMVEHYQAPATTSTPATSTTASGGGLVVHNGSITFIKPTKPTEQITIVQDIGTCQVGQGISFDGEIYVKQQDGRFISQTSGRELPISDNSLFTQEGLSMYSNGWFNLNTP